MVGRLVEQQYIGPAEQDFSQFDAHVPALGESFGLASELLFLEAQPHQGPFDRLLRSLALRKDQLVVDLIELDDQPMISI